MPQLVTSLVLFGALTGIEIACSGHPPEILSLNVGNLQKHVHNRNYVHDMLINFPKDYFMNVTPFRTLKDEDNNPIICNVVWTMLQCRNDLDNLLKQLDEMHPMYNFTKSLINSLSSTLHHLNMGGDSADNGMHEHLKNKKTPASLIVEMRDFLNILQSTKFINFDEWNCSDRSQFHDSVSALPTSVYAQPATTLTTKTMAPTPTFSPPQTSAALPHPRSTASSVTEPFYIHNNADITPNSDADVHHSFSEDTALTTDKDGRAASTPASESSVGNTIEETTKNADEVLPTTVSITIAEKKRSLKLLPTKKTIPTHHTIGKRDTHNRSLRGGEAQTPPIATPNPQGSTSTAHQLHLTSWGLVFALLSPILSNIA